MFEDIAKQCLEYACDADYGDIRVESFDNTAIDVIDNDIKRGYTYHKKGVAIRVIVDGAWGFQSTSEFSNHNLKTATEKAMAMARAEARTSKKSVQFAPINIHEDSVKPEFKIDYRDISLEDKIDLVLEWNKAMMVDSNIVKTVTQYNSSFILKYLENSEGTRIHFTRPLVGVTLTSIAKGEEGIQSYSSNCGGTGGHELLMGGDLTSLCKKVGEKSLALTKAKPAPEMRDTQIVFEPDYMSLLVHEIAGHPSEADRVLGRESAWAGTSWFKGQLGKKIGSEYVTVFDDPTIEGQYGYYLYDDEGTPARRKKIIDKGVLTEFMHSRETAAIFEVEPNSGMRANTYEYFPLIRMSNTFWGSGDWKADEIIEETKKGVYIVGARSPSIDDARYQWAISSQEGWLIEDGELTTHLRNCLVTETSPVFFKSVDALADDLAFISHGCGKGDPRQCSTVGNGGPHMRGVATVVGRR